MSAKSHLMKHFHCDAALYDRAKQLWFQDMALECMLLGERFERLKYETVGKYLQKAANERKQNVQEMEA